MYLIKVIPETITQLDIFVLIDVKQFNVDMPMKADIRLFIIFYHQVGEI